MTYRALAALTWLAACAAQAQEPPEVRASDAAKISVTIYRDNLALITETRTIPAANGEARVVFPGVLDNAIPQSAVIAGLGGAEKERNFSFDGLTPRSLLNRSIGERVRVARFNPGTGEAREEEATIAAAGDGVSMQFDNRVEALGCSGLPEKLIFARIPDGLTATPTLSTLTTLSGPAREVTLSYLSVGLEWSADYVLTVNEDYTRAAVTGWITLTNAGEQGFGEAQVGVVAGDLNRVWSGPARQEFWRMAHRACWPLGTTSDLARLMPPPPPPPPPMPVMAMEAADAIIVTAARKSVNFQDTPIAIAQQEELGDYQLYSLPSRTALNARQTKQVAFLAKDDVKIARLHRFRVGGPDEMGDGEPEPQATQIVLVSKNETSQGLGAPLPKGSARVFAPHQDSALFAGVDETEDTAVGLDWELEVGESASVSVTPRTANVSRQRLSKERTRVSADMEMILVNSMSTPQTIEVIQYPAGDNVRVSNASLRAGKKYGYPAWTVTLPAQSEQVLRYRLRYVE
jgi:hypothetical protein